MGRGGGDSGRTLSKIVGSIFGFEKIIDIFANVHNYMLC